MLSSSICGQGAGSVCKTVRRPLILSEHIENYKISGSAFGPRKRSMSERFGAKVISASASDDVEFLEGISAKTRRIWYASR